MAIRTLKPGVHILARSGGRIQVGLDPDLAIVMPATTIEDARAWLAGADPLPVALAGLVTEQPTVGTETLDGLTRLNVHRNQLHLAASSEVQIHGAGRLGMLIAMLLGSAGIPHVRLIDSSPVGMDDITPWGPSRIDLGARRDHVGALILSRLRRDALHRQIYPTPVQRTLAVFAPPQRADWPWFDPSIADDALSHGSAHVVATTSTRAAMVSSVIVPGQTACLRCRTEAQSDMDRDWPLMCSQVAAKLPIDQAPSALVAATALVAVAHVEGWLRDEPVNDSPSMSLITWPAGQATESQWQAHPRCGCTWDQLNAA